MLLVDDDWAEDHHDVEVQDEDGRRLARARSPEGIAGEYAAPPPSPDWIPCRRPLLPRPRPRLRRRLLGVRLPASCRRALRDPLLPLRPRPPLRTSR